MLDINKTSLHSLNNWIFYKDLNNLNNAKEKFLHSSIFPLLVKEEQITINDCFRKEMKKSDQLEISVGFSSFYSLRELDKLITAHNIKNVSLIFGMYFFNGFPKPLHQLALEINKKWQD